MWIETTTGQWFEGADGRRWWFDSGSLALDFAYSGAIGDNDAWERLLRPDDLDAWFADHLRASVRSTVDDLVGAKRLRSAIAELFLTASRGAEAERTDAATVDAFGARADVAPQLARPVAASPARLLSVVARDAIVTMQQRADRVRSCGSNNCGLVYLDTSRSASRTWCSMQRCGNRHKVRAHRARAQLEAPRTTTTSNRKDNV
jgi:predicted RNA-binding Zn ribbon-like protein